MQNFEPERESFDGLGPAGCTAPGHEQICEMLESIALLRDLERRDIEALAECARVSQAPAGTTIFYEGEKDPFICFVVEGRLDILKERSAATQRKLATIRAGKVIGEMSMIDGLPHSATVIASEPSTLLMISRAGLEHLEQTHPRLALRLVWKLARELSQRLRLTSGMLIDHL